MSSQDFADVQHARTSLQQAVDFSFDDQQPDGHWVAEVSADVTFTSEYVMFKYQIGLDLSDGEDLKRWLLNDQKDDGSWGLAPTLPGNVSTTTEAYLALKILGVSQTNPAMVRSQNFMKKNGGVAKTRFFTRFFLATFGLVPWSAIPQMPVELILMPPSFPLNIYTLSSWARSTLIPILIVRHHEPVYALPNGRNSNNNFLDELWCNPNDKHVPFSLPLAELFWKKEYIELGFTALDKILVQLGGLKHSPTRGIARRKCIDWLEEHQEEAGDWAGFFPPMHGSIWALLLEGYPLDHRRVVLGLESLERLAITDARGKRIPPTVSPVWDTSLMINALCEANVNDPRIDKAVQWVKDRQLMGKQGDWRIYSSNTQAGGWSFEYYNTWYPDVDDTAVVVMALIKHDSEFIGSECISNAVEWILGMENHDGGYGAFDYNNDKLWLHKIPFSDMDSLCDPSSEDITGRVLECWGFLLSHRGGTLDPKLKERVRASAERGIDYLVNTQASFGGWWGRWGNNYNYGSGNCMRGLAYFASHSEKARRMVALSLRWWDDCQNEDGGWGEHLESYTNPKMIGKGISCAAQTSWALLSLLPFRPASDPRIQRGIKWLISNQSIKSTNGSSWDTYQYTATGFPSVLYLGYPYYHHFFPIMALNKYVNGRNDENLKVVELSSHVVEQLNCPCILLMVVGSRGDIQVFLNIAKLLQRSYGYRARIATHPCHQKFVESEGIEFYNVGGNPADFAKSFTEKPNILVAAAQGDFANLRKAFYIMIDRFWKSSIDPHANVSLGEKGKSLRPFVANSIVSSLSTLVHVHCAQKLEIPLVLVSVQPLLPTSDFPQVLTMHKPKFGTSRVWNYLSYFCLEILNWMAFGSWINQLRGRKYGMKLMSWTWITYDFLHLKIPHICLWSPRVLHRPSEWDQDITIAGYAFSEQAGYEPASSLEAFLETDKPVLAISFGSASVPDPRKLMTIAFSAIAKLNAKAVVCLNESVLGEDFPVPEHIYLAREVPHSWLLPRVKGFVHHGGAGHTAAGLRYGVPMLIMPYFLDQNFWAAKIQQLQLGPPPLSHKHLTVKTLVNQLKDLLGPKYKKRSAELAYQISHDRDGAEVAAEAVVRSQISANNGPLCAVVSALNAHWKHESSGLTISGAVAACLVSHQVMHWSDLKSIPSMEWDTLQPRSSNSVIDFLAWATAFIYSLIGMLATMLRIFDIRRNKQDRSSSSVDVVREARIKQAEYDFHFAAQDTDVQERIVGTWRILTTAKLHEKFVEHQI